jgi:PHD/YefM family antitoxin component YafN of YafNO toxin-antitoxin module
MAAVIRSFKGNDAPCYITQHGKAAAVLLPVYRFEALMSVLEDAEDDMESHQGRRLAQARREFTQGGGIALEDYLKRRKRKR